MRDIHSRQFVHSRQFGFACGWILLFASSTMAANTDNESSIEPTNQPYSVWAAAAGTRVYSGPGEEYYATLDLPAGTECEVYEATRDGWLAIRPPEGSFSLVASSAIEKVEGNVARVTRRSVSSRVGSLLVADHDVVHVRLEEGEQVRLVDAAADELSAWVKISPPAGEFRWVRESDVSRERVAPKTKPIVLEAQTAGDPEDTNWREREEETGLDATTGTPSLTETPVSAVEAASHDDWVAAKPTNLLPPALMDADTKKLPPTVAAASAQPTIANPPAVATTPSPFDKQVDWLEIEISRRIAGPPNLWHFDDLERRAAQLLSAANTPERTATVNQLAARLSRFSTLAKRVRTTDLPQETLAGRTQPSSSELAAHDAVGVLRPVVSKRGNAPPYALVDEQGAVVTFLTPSPSLNMQPYLGKRIGVSGTQGYLPEYRRKNIQTARITPLDGARLR